MREARGLISEGIKIIPNIHNAFFSHAQLSDKRKEDIALRRDKLKVESNDPFILRIVIEEILSYKPRLITLDDRYLQLEKILDAIDNARIGQNTDNLILICSEINKELLRSPDKLNIFLKCMTRIDSRILEFQSTHQQAKL
jgi:hypothetical protein